MDCSETISNAEVLRCEDFGNNGTGRIILVCGASQELEATRILAERGIIDYQLILTDDTSVTKTDIVDSFDKITIHNPYLEGYNETCFVIDEQIKEVRSGWHNPKKIAIPKNNKPNNIRMQTRNQLPYKFRRIDSNN